MDIETITKILGLGTNIKIEASDMAKEITLTYYPYKESEVSKNVLSFNKKLKKNLIELGVKIIPFEEALVTFPRSKKVKLFLYGILNSIINPIEKLIFPETYKERLGIGALRYVNFDKKIRKGISVISLTDNKSGNLPMDRTLSFRDSSVITILDMPNNINEDSEFHDHFDQAMHLFTYYMTNLAIIVSENKWILYNFNASHPTYPINTGNFKEILLDSFIPKIAAPIIPPKISDFEISKIKYDIYDTDHKPYVEDIVRSGQLLEKTELYPPGKSVDEMSFRNEFYKWIGKIHLDQRNGMSYGFLARQMKTKLSDVYTEEEASVKFKSFSKKKGYFYEKDDLHIKIRVGDKNLYLKAPEVWVLTQRSGSKKTNINPSKDIIKMGLVNGVMKLQLPKGMTKMPSAYKPSFDTQVILAHSVGNAILASVSSYFGKNSEFVNKLKEKGLCLAHWHGYIDPNKVPEGWHVYGQFNPHVSCSSPQSAYYALSGKINVFQHSMLHGIKYSGDIHIEPHHGTNITYWSLTELGEYLNSTNKVSVLGNKYLEHYKNLT